LLTSCPTDDYATTACRPAWSVLDTSRFENLSGEALPHWDDAIDRFLTELESDSA
jgi:dTDP-4-dehydrorhamnose reductase